MIKGKTKSDEYKEKKREMEEDLDYLRQVDLPESQGGGRKYVTDIIKEEEKKEKKKKNEAKNYVDSKSAIFGYKERVAQYAYEEIMKQQFPLDWNYYCVPTDGRVLDIFGKKYKTQTGIVYIIRSPRGEVYVRALRLSYDPNIDIENIHTMIVQIENTIDSWKGILLSDNIDTRSSFRKTSSGLILPN